MLRDKALIPLSHQHHNALALCVRIQRSLSPEHADRWAPAEPEQLQELIDTLFRNEIQYHFQAEEEVLFPAATALPELALMAKELLAEHESLRQYAAQAAARKLGKAELQAFAGLLSGHVRKEEGQLFEQLQKALSPAELKALGEKLEAYFSSSGMPGPACEVRP